MYPNFTVRLGTQDLMVVQEVLCQNEYRLPARFTLKDVIIDVGAHIGAFAAACLIRGAGKVICYEPDPDNFALLQQNLAQFGDQVECHPDALWPLSQGEAYLLKREQSRLTAMSHCIATFGEPVAGLSLDDMLDCGSPVVRLLKLDCEGGEWPGLFEVGASSLSGTQEVIGELHHQMKRPDWPLAWTAEALKAQLSAQGYQVELASGTMPEMTSHFFARRAA